MSEYSLGTRIKVLVMVAALATMMAVGFALSVAVTSADAAKCPGTGEQATNEAGGIKSCETNEPQKNERQFTQQETTTTKGAFPNKKAETTTSTCVRPGPDRPECPRGQQL